MFDNPLYEHRDIEGIEGIEGIEDIEVFNDEILRLRERVTLLEQENKYLHRTLEETQALKIQLESNLLLPVTKQTRKLSHATKAFMIYLNEQRNNSDFVHSIRTKMKTMGYDIHHRKNIPYQVLKLECDLLYGQLSASDRHKYMEMAQRT